MVTEATPISVADIPVPELAPVAPVPETPPAAEAIPPAPEVAPPVAPEVAPAPLLPPVAIDERLAQERVALRQRETEIEQRENERLFQDAFSRRQKELEEQDGLPPERAQALAQREIAALWRAYQAEQLAETAIKEERAKTVSALLLGARFNVPAASLLDYNTPQEMFKAAQHGTEQTKIEARLAALEKENTELKKGRIPAQSFSQGVTDSSGATATPDNIDALYLKDPDRYGPAYRKFLASR